MSIKMVHVLIDFVATIKNLYRLKSKRISNVFKNFSQVRFNHITLLVGHVICSPNKWSFWHFILAFYEVKMSKKRNFLKRGKHWHLELAWDFFRVSGRREKMRRSKMTDLVLWRWPTVLLLKLKGPVTNI